MLAQLGNFVFQNLKVFNEFNKTSSVIYAEHSLLDRKPRLQRTGTALDTLTLSTRLHAAFCNPLQQVKILRASKDEGEIMPLLWGNGELEGTFVISEMQEIIEETDSTGNIFSYLVSLSLTEYVSSDRLRQEQQNNKKKAKAVGDKKPTAKTKNNPPTCEQGISKIISSIESHAAQINAVFVEQGYPSTVVSKTKTKQHLNVIQRYCDQIITRSNDPKSCLHDYPDIITKAQLVRAEVPIFINLINNPPSGEIVFGENSGFQNKVKALKTAARPLINKAITRK